MPASGSAYNTKEFLQRFDLACRLTARYLFIDRIRQVDSASLREVSNTEQGIHELSASVGERLSAGPLY